MVELYFIERTKFEKAYESVWTEKFTSWSEQFPFVLLPIGFGIRKIKKKQKKTPPT